MSWYGAARPSKHTRFATFPCERRVLPRARGCQQGHRTGLQTTPLVRLSARLLLAGTRKGNNTRIITATRRGKTLQPERPPSTIVSPPPDLQPSRLRPTVVCPRWRRRPGPPIVVRPCPSRRPGATVACRAPRRSRGDTPRSREASPSRGRGWTKEGWEGKVGWVKGGWDG